MKDAVKNAGRTFLKGLLPLVLTFLGTVFGGLIGVDEKATSAIGATLGTILYTKV